MRVHREPNIIIASNTEELARHAADRLVARVDAAQVRAAVCLTGGSSPERLYTLLGSESYRSKVPWDRVHWFMGDDRFVPTHHPHSNMGMAMRLFLDRVEIPPGNIHPIATDAESPDAAARMYEAELKRFYGRDRIDPPYGEPGTFVPVREIRCASGAMRGPSGDASARYAGDLFSAALLPPAEGTRRRARICAAHAVHPRRNSPPLRLDDSGRAHAGR